MIATWQGTYLEFLVPILMTLDRHVIVIFEHSAKYKVECVIKDSGGGTESFTNCPGTGSGKFKDHDYWATKMVGEIYQIDIRYAKVDCSDSKPPDIRPTNCVGFGATSPAGPHQVEQWRFSDSLGEAVCGITILVIDDIVGPDPTKMVMLGQTGEAVGSEGSEILASFELAATTAE